MHPTPILLVFVVCIIAGIFEDTSNILTVFAIDNHNSSFKYTYPSNNTQTKNTSWYDCNNFLSVSCRLPSCDIQPNQLGCPLQVTKPNISSAYNSLREFKNH
jgi:hypothetical protein